MDIKIKPGNLLFVLFMLLTGYFAQAQTFNVKGQVSTGHAGYVSYATVTLRSVPDSALVRGANTDSTGRFMLSGIDTGAYLLTVQSLGMFPHAQQLEVKDGDLDLPLIQLQVDSAQYTLGAVTVTAQKPLLRREIDKLVVDIAGSVYSRGENAMRLFNVIPGVQTDAFGNIRYRGTEAVTVYVDNVRVPLSGQQLANYLKGIPSESIKSYEVRSIGGAQFDANNTGTIVNILLKSDYKYGLSGNIGAEYQYTRYNNASGYGNVEYSTKKFTFQVGGSVYKGTQFEDQQETQYYKSSGIYSFQRNYTLTDAFFANYKVGLDYRMNKNQVLTANFERTSFPYRPSTVSDNLFSMGSRAGIDSAVTTTNNKDIRQITSQASFLYRNKLDTAGSRLDVGYNYIDYDNRYYSDIATNFTYPGEEGRNFSNELSINNPLSIRLHTISADLEKKLTNAWVLNFGAKYNISDTDNDIAFLSEPGADRRRSNQYKYDEKILAFYGSFAKDWDKWGLKVGLRTENTNYNGRSVTTGEDVTFDRWSLFPSVFLQNKINSTNSLTASYSRSINRPSYQLLNPFENIQNPFYIETGNPFLLPYFTHKTELSYLLNSKYNFTLGYNRTTNSINNVYANEGPVIISTYGNVNDDNNVFFSASMPVKLFDWWEFNSMLTLRYTRLNIKVTDFNRVKERFSQEIWVSNKFRFGNGFFAEAIAQYGRNQFLGIYDWKPQGNINVNFKKNFANDKLALTLNFADPFNLRRIGWTVNEREFSRDVNYWLPTRFVSFGISYNFSKGKNKVSRENINRQDQDEKGRLNK